MGHKTLHRKQMIRNPTHLKKKEEEKKKKIFIVSTIQIIKQWQCWVVLIL